MSRYDIEKFDPPPDPDLVCCICQCVLDKAVECPCRHVFCQICIERWLSNRHTCPTCRKRTRKTDLKPVLPLVQNMLNRLMMVCDYRDNGCLDKVMLENFERHVKNCGYEMKTCRFSKCGKSILRMYIEVHENEECPHREIVCEGECGLMIPLSESSVHNCVTALKAHIEEKNRMIEQLKVKLHELNNLSQSLNDQLVELRQQLSDRNRLFSEDMSDISESDITDYMSDELSQDSEFQDSWFDSTASNGSVDNANAADNDVSNNDAANNVTDQDNNALGGNGGSDVVQQVERTVVSSLFELSSRLERVRNQMRAVLNSGLVQDANTLNDEVRIPSAALDAIVNNSNGDASRPTNENSDDENHRNDRNNNNDERNNHEDENESSIDHDVSDSDLSIHSGEEDVSDHTARMSDNNGDSNANHPWSYSSHDSFDGSWISATDSHHTPNHDSPSSRTSSYYDNNDANDNYANDDPNNKDHYSSTHVILSQPPDSPSDTTGSFSSIPSTWSMENSPVMSHSHDEDSQDGRSDSLASSASLQGTPAYRNNKSSDSSEHSESTCRLTDHVECWLPHRSTDSTGIDSDNQSRPRFSFSSHDSSYSNDCSMSPHSGAGNASGSSAVDYMDSADELKSDGDNAACEYVHTSESDNETSHVECKTPGHEAENSHESHSDKKMNPENHTQSDHENDANSIDFTDAIERLCYDENYKEIHENNAQVSKCEPDSTQSPGGHQSQFGSVGWDVKTPVVISTATDSSDSSESESMKYLTKRRRQVPNHSDYGENNGSGEITVADVVQTEANQLSMPLGLENLTTGINSSKNYENSYSSKSGSRRRKMDNDIGCTHDAKRSRSAGMASIYLNGSANRFSPSTDSGIVPDYSPGDSPSAHRYGFRKRLSEGETRLNIDNNRNIKTSGANQNSCQSAQSGSHLSPSRHRPSRRDTTQHSRRSRSSASKRTSNQTNVTTDNNGQSLNVKIDLSLINYSGHLNNESSNSSVPTATVVHGSANISPLSASTTVGRREANHNYSRQHSSESNKASTQKAEDSSHHSNYKTRSSQNQKHEGQLQSRNSAGNTSTPKSINTTNNLSNRDFPNCWRDESDNSSDENLESGSGNSGTEDAGFESDSSYEVEVPKSTAVLLEEYASDESDESWTVGMV